MLKAHQAQETRDVEETFTLTVLDATKVTFKSGFDVVEVKTGFESRQILLENIPATASPADVTAALGIFGEIIAVLPADPDEDFTSAFRVTFTRAESAINAAAAVNGTELFPGY